MELIVELVKILWQKSDPMLIACILILGYWQRQTAAKVDEQKKRLDAHLNPDPKDNAYPHPQCAAHEACYEDLKEHMQTQHQETLGSINGLTERIDRALERRCE